MSLLEVVPRDLPDTISPIYPVFVDMLTDVTLYSAGLHFAVLSLVLLSIQCIVLYRAGKAESRLNRGDGREKASRPKEHSREQIPEEAFLEEAVV